MQILFKDIPSGFLRAKVSEIKEKEGIYGPYLRIIFSIIEEGELAHYRFSGCVKPNPLKISKFYRWVTNILGKEPGATFSTHDMIGKECMVSLSKQNTYYCVKDVSMKLGVSIPLQRQAHKSS